MNLNELFELDYFFWVLLRFESISFLTLDQLKTAAT